ncbi:MAG: hypothetical protein JW904_15370 [Spirochaetales bacterium]|nr:hypothetical protein [Spirochaetales bacterium]
MSLKPHTIFILIFLCLIPVGINADDIPELQLFMYNDSMGTGWAQDWDDHRTFGAGAAYFIGDPVKLESDYMIVIRAIFGVE